MALGHPRRLFMLTDNNLWGLLLGRQTHLQAYNPLLLRGHIDNEVPLDQGLTGKGVPLLYLLGS